MLVGNRFTVSIMFAWLLELWTSFMTWIMSLFGMTYGEKKVHFEDDKKEPSEESAEVEEAKKDA